MLWQRTASLACMGETHSRDLWLGVILHSASPLPTHWLLATLGWSVIHFREPLHSNYQRGVRGKVSSWDMLPYGPRWNISNQGEAISSWHIINQTCCGFPLGSSSDTSENTPSDVVLNQRDTAHGAGISTNSFNKSVKVERQERSAAPPLTLSTAPVCPPSFVWFELETVFLIILLIV